MDSLIQKNIRAIVALVLIGAAFWGGYAWGASAPSRMAGTQSIPHPPDSAPQGPHIVPVIGTVVSVSGSTIIVKDPLHAQQKVNVGPTTKITTTKVINESVADIHAGDQISAFGAADGAGVLQAEMIQTNVPAPLVPGAPATSSAAAQ